MKIAVPLPNCELNKNALNMFYRITLWVENNKNCKLQTKKLADAKKQFSSINVIKDVSTVPNPMARNTLYVPRNYSGKDILKQLRNAFCHNGIKYNSNKRQYEILKSKHIKISGSVSFKAIVNLIEVLLSDI